MAFKTYNIAYARIAARLNLDDFQRDRPGVSETKNFAQGDGESSHELYPRLPKQSDDGVSISSVHDLETAAFVNAVLPAQRVVHLAVQGVFFTRGVLQLGDDVLDVLATGFVGHQHGVGRFHHDQVFYADQVCFLAHRLQVIPIT
jgi:hypothetical protein